jgi:hypothetical protein
VEHAVVERDVRAGLIWQKTSACSAIRSLRGSTTISFVPRRLACLKNEEATGWFAVVFVPARIATPALMMSP